MTFKFQPHHAAARDDRLLVGERVRVKKHQEAWDSHGGGPVCEAYFGVIAWVNGDYVGVVSDADLKRARKTHPWAHLASDVERVLKPSP